MSLEPFRSLRLLSPRFYIAAPLAIDSTVILSEQVAHHMRVCRLEPGSPIVLFNGQGGEFEAQLIHFNKRDALAQVKTFSPIERESKLNITVAQALIANDKMDWVVQKSVELGVKAIQPLITHRSQGGASSAHIEKRWQHWQHIAIAACEQCGRNTLPLVAHPQTLQTWISTLQHNSLKIMLSLTSQHPLRQLQPLHSIYFGIGPEGGWTVDEETTLLQTGWQSVNLGPSVLRAETAAISALASAQALWGN